MKRRAIIGLATIATLGGCSDRASLDVAEAETTEPADVVVEVAAETPEACRLALLNADDVIDLAADAIRKGNEAIFLAGDAFGAISDYDLAALEGMIPKLEAIADWYPEHAPKIGAARAAYDKAKAACLNP